MPNVRLALLARIAGPPRNHVQKTWNLAVGSIARFESRVSHRSQRFTRDSENYCNNFRRPLVKRCPPSVAGRKHGFHGCYVAFTWPLDPMHIYIYIPFAHVYRRCTVYLTINNPPKLFICICRSLTRILVHF